MKDWDGSLKTGRSELDELIGDVPYLNGGIFDVHELERKYWDIEISDLAFIKLFDFFDDYDWHLDERPLRADNEINPDVLGYIFEKYVNQKQMGAYYTKEDITGYIAQNTVIPRLFDMARKECAIAFRPDSALWRLLSEDPDRYIYDSMRKGVDEPLPADVAAGLYDVAQRGGWNVPADDAYALPTETWREHVARRQRYEEVWTKLVDGEVHRIDDLITLNLDIRQLAKDAILDCEGPELLRAFWKAIRDISVLDPACGSGAFLFAALNVLEPLYEACLKGMQAFVHDLDRSDTKHRPEKFRDFRECMNEVARHPNRRHYILKSIVIGNLYGVDIMEEAVEICKQRLFLKLAAQADTVDELEPLPDIDFNIRAGNSLVGFARLEDVEHALTYTMDFERVLPGILERAELADKAFSRFREMQTAYDMPNDDFVAAKLEIRHRLGDLRAQLDGYLATAYGLHDTSGRRFSAWRSSHQPFHWFVEYFGIMATGGFDAVIGNPPYVELNTLTQYSTDDHSYQSSGNLYALFLERSLILSGRTGRARLILPVSSVSTNRYRHLQTILSSRLLHYSSFDDRPSRLFDGIQHCRLTIHLLGDSNSPPRLISTCYRKWNADERPHLFASIRYEKTPRHLGEGMLPKLGSRVDIGIIQKLSAQRSTLSSFYSTTDASPVYYSRKIGYFLQVLNFRPTVLDGHGDHRPPSEFKELGFTNDLHAKLALCCLNSNLFYWFVTTFSDCRHVNKREVDAFPVNLNELSSGTQSERLARSCRPSNGRSSEDI